MASSKLSSQSTILRFEELANQMLEFEWIDIFDAIVISNVLSNEDIKKLLNDNVLYMLTALLGDLIKDLSQAEVDKTSETVKDAKPNGKQKVPEEGSEAPRSNVHMNPIEQKCSDSNGTNVLPNTQSVGSVKDISILAICTLISIVSLALKAWHIANTKMSDLVLGLQIFFAFALMSLVPIPAVYRHGRGCLNVLSWWVVTACFIDVVHFAASVFELLLVLVGVDVQSTSYFVFECIAVVILLFGCLLSCSKAAYLLYQACKRKERLPVVEKDVQFRNQTYPRPNNSPSNDSNLDPLLIH